jgi:glycosyltransferase involved in cell wall biosynthesis
MAKSILYVHYVAEIVGSGISLKVLMQNLDRNKYVPHLLQTASATGEYGKLIESSNIPVDHLPTYLVWGLPWLSEVNLRGRAWRSFRIDKQVQRYLEKLKPDLVHVNDFPPVSVGLTASAMGFPVVWHIRRVIMHDRPWLDPWPQEKRVMLKHADRIIAVAEPEAKQMGQSEKLRLIHNPLDLAEIASKRGSGKQCRQTMGIAEDEFVVLAPIPLSVEKGAWDFIRACGIARRIIRGKRLRFVLAGYLPTAGRRHLLRARTGWLGPEPDLQVALRLARQAGIDSHLILTGFRKDIYELMDASDVVVFPSHMKSCGRPCIEAGALGKPILVTLPDKECLMVKDGMTGWILPEKNPQALGESIAMLAQDREQGERMGQAGLEYVTQNFSAPIYAQKIMRLYDEVLS